MSETTRTDATANNRAWAITPPRRSRTQYVAIALVFVSCVGLAGCSGEEIPTDPIVLNEEVKWAAQHGTEHRLRALIDAGGDAAQRDLLGWTPLHYAVNRFHSESYDDLGPVEALLESPEVDIHSRTNDGTSAILIAAQHGRIELLELLLENGASLEIQEGDHFTPLAAALRKGRLEMAQYLLSKGVDVNEPLPGGGNALFIAIRGRNLEAMQLLIDAGVEIHGGPHAAAPIIFAAAGRNLQVVRLLIEAGADVNAVNPVNGMTALHRAVGSGPEMVKLLLDSGARPGVSNQE